MRRFDARRGRRTRTGLTAIAVAAGLVGCGGTAPVAPPEIVYGQDACAECVMIVSDDRFAAALVLEADGRRETPVFDDLGCAAAYEAARPEATVLARYVREASGGGWLVAEDATYLLSEALHTPMAYGVGATATPEAAAELAERFPGEAMGFDRLWPRLKDGAGPGAFSTAASSDSDDPR